MKKRWWALGAGVVALALAAGAVWYFVFRDDAPPAVDLATATESLRDGQREGASSQRSSTMLDGTWTIDPDVGSFDDFTSSFVGFRVQEELVSIGAKTAVGRTPDVTGTIRISGSTVPEASFEVDMTTLTTDDSRRDNQLRSQAIETSRFPKASFVATEPIQLGRIPADDERLTVSAVGDLTLHGVTRRVTFPLEARRTGDVIAVVGQIGIEFADYSIARPRAAAVLSVEERGVIEVQLFFTKRP